MKGVISQFWQVDFELFALKTGGIVFFTVIEDIIYSNREVEDDPKHVGLKCSAKTNCSLKINKTFQDFAAWRCWWASEGLA